MPSLKLFGRRTAFSGDDIRLYLVLLALYKMIQFGLSCGLICITVRDNENRLINILKMRRGCVEIDENADKISFIYSVASILVHSISLILVGPMFYFSGMGTPTDQGPRKPMTNLCYFDIFGMNFVRCILFGLGVAEIKNMYDYWYVWES